MDLIQQFAAVALVLGMLAGAMWLLRRKQGFLPRPSAKRQMEVVERVTLTPQHSLALVRVNGNLVLVGTGPGVCEIRNVEASS